MEPRDLNRMFDALAPTRSQEQAGLSRLLQTERKGRPMKKLKKLTVLGVAAALMVISCAAAVVTGIDKRLLDYFGASPEQAELLAPGAVPVDVTVEDNGATLHISQVLMDRYNILILYDFTAPEGTVLDMGDDSCYQGFNYEKAEVWLNQAGEPIEYDANGGIIPIDDGDPLDNHFSQLIGYNFEDGIQPEWELSGVSLSLIDLVRYDPEKREMVPVYSGDWSCEVPFTWQDTGQTIWPDQIVGQLDGKNIILTELYFSPMIMRICYERDIPPLNTRTWPNDYRWNHVLESDCMTLTTGDGKVIPLETTNMSWGISDYQKQHHVYQLGEVVALEDLEGGTLNIRIEGGSVDIPLDGLVPAE